MESYNDFLNRVNAFETPTFGIALEDFKPSNSVFQKVTSNNRFAPFYGDTIVFDLSIALKNLVSYLTHMLHSELPNCFCERLHDSTVHLTLHDLVNCPSREEVSEKMDSNLRRIVDMIIDNPVKKTTIDLRPVCVMNMVNTSVVLALQPVSEEDYYKIISVYEMFEEIVKLPYKFTPHITLAYYNRDGFSYSDVLKLKATIEKVNEVIAANPFNSQVFVTTEDLFYQRFTSMNYYISYLRLAL